MFKSKKIFVKNLHLMRLSRSHVKITLMFTDTTDVKISFTKSLNSLTYTNTCEHVEMCVFMQMSVYSLYGDKARYCIVCPLFCVLAQSQRVADLNYSVI